MLTAYLCESSVYVECAAPVYIRRHWSAYIASNDLSYSVDPAVRQSSEVRCHRGVGPNDYTVIITLYFVQLPGCVTVFAMEVDPAPPPLKGHSRQFSAHARCGQTAGWTKMPPGVEVGLGLGDCVRWGPSSPRKKGTAPPTQFSAQVYCGQTAGWMNSEDATWYGSRLWPRPHCVRRGPTSPCERDTAAPSFRPMSVVATVAHLSYCWALVLDFSARAQTAPVDRFRRSIRQWSAFWGRDETAAHLEGQIAKKKNLEAWIGVLKPKSRNLHRPIIELTVSITSLQPNFAQR